MNKHALCSYVSRILRASGLINPSTTDPATANLKIAFPGFTSQQLVRLAAAHYSAMRQMRRDLSYVSHLRKTDLTSFCRQRVCITGLSTLRAAVADPRPVIFVSPHYGAVSLGCLRLILELSPNKQVTICSSPPGVDTSRSALADLIRELDRPVNIVNNDGGGVLKGLSALRNGGALGILPDMFNQGSKRVVFVPFFGRLAIAMSGAAWLALKANATIVPFYCYRQDRRAFRLQIEAPIKWDRTDDEQQDIYAITAKIFRQFEEQLTCRPEPWIYWTTFHRLFKHASALTLPLDTEWLKTRLEVLRTRMPGNRRELTDVMELLLQDRTMSLNAQS